ncbi:MAG: S1 family peptidase, partial [Acidobacteriota bacterium]
RFVLGAFVLMVFSSAGPSRSEDLTDGFSRDAEAYASYFNVGLKEAKHRLVLQRQAGALDELLAEEAVDTFGGLWIDHAPKFKVTVLSTDAGMMRPLLRAHLERDLAALVEVEAADVTLASLLAQQEEVREFLQAEKLEADLSIDIRESTVIVESSGASRLEATLAEKRFALPASVEIRQVSSLAKPNADLRGGRSLLTCTAGFTVRTPTGRLGIATAGHCGDFQRYADSFTPLTLQAEHYAGSHDVQWHTATCSDTIKNEIYDGTAFRTINGTVGRGSQSTGTFVCKHGRTTGHTCGIIFGRNYCPSYVPSGRSTFITVIGNNLSAPGDSGGPWFVGSKAYGIHSGSTSSGRAIYMAADWMATVGYPVLNYAAGSNPWVRFNCHANAYSFSCSASGNSGMSPYSFSNWSYSGPATSWNASSSSISGSFGFPGCPPGAYNSVQVRMTDACGRTTQGYGEFYCPGDSDPSCEIDRICDIGIQP